MIIIYTDVKNATAMGESSVLHVMGIAKLKLTSDSQ